MAVGTLNVAVTASTYQARKELNGLRTDVAGLASGIKSSSNSLGGHQDVIHGVRDSYKALHHAAVALFIIPKVFGETVKFGQWLRQIHDEMAENPLSDGWDEALRSLKAYYNAAESLEAERARKMEQQQRIQEAYNKAAIDRAEAERKKYKEIDEAIASEKSRGLEAREGPTAAKYEEDKAKYGKEAALKILEARERADAEEFDRDAKKKAKEDAARKKKEEFDKKEEKLLKEQKMVTDLRHDVADFELSDVAKERAELMRQLTNPILRLQAYALFGKQDAQRARKMGEEWAKEDEETIAGRKPEDTKALDARTTEGWVALRDSLKGGGVQQKTMEYSKRTADNMDRLVKAAEEKIAAEDAFNPFAA